MSIGGRSCLKLEKEITPLIVIVSYNDFNLPGKQVLGPHERRSNQQLPTLQLLTFSQSGHASYHQQPEAAAEHIATLVRATVKVGGSQETHSQTVKEKRL
jgi:hypothetical protein